MEELRKIGEALGSLKSLMVFEDNIQINKRQCSLLYDAFNLAFDVITEQIRMKMIFEDRFTKWKALESPLREFNRIQREGEEYIRQCMEFNEWWGRAISLGKSNDCLELYLHELLFFVSVILEAIESSAEKSGYVQHGINRNKIIHSKKYESVWMDPKMFQQLFGREYLISTSICDRMDSSWKEDQWMLQEMALEKRCSSRQEKKLSDIFGRSTGIILPVSMLVESPDYQVKRRLGSEGHHREIIWMGESFVVCHFFGDIKPLIPKISLLSSLSHPNVMPLICCFFDEERKQCFLLTNLMYRSLYSYMKEIISPRRRIAFSLPVAVDILLQIARGMEYLHSHCIFHGNLNPCTILVKQRNSSFSSASSSSSSEVYLIAKVTSIGILSCKNIKKSAKNISSNPCIWFAPEVLLEQEQKGDAVESRVTEKADVYSFGMICFELLTGKVPFEDSHMQGDKMSKNIRAGERPLFPFSSPKCLTSLTKRCWQADPLHRPSFSSVCRVLRYIKRFIVLNPDQNQCDSPSSVTDFFDLDTRFSRLFPNWVVPEVTPISMVPFQMFAFKVIEKEKMMEVGSELASIDEDEKSYGSSISDDHQLSPLKQFLNDSKLKSVLPQKKKMNKGRPAKQQARGRTMRMNSESQLPKFQVILAKRRPSGHVSDSEVP
ncbi:uncharacterized protein LOC144709900 isoform X2 [Wolffia australiana]